jgi:hypothetical protein
MKPLTGLKKLSSSAGQPTAAPSGIDEIAGEAIFALQLYEVRGYSLEMARKVARVGQSLGRNMPSTAS